MFLEALYKRERTYQGRLVVTQLVKGIYADAKTKLYVAPPFGLKQDQWRAAKPAVLKISRWYNKHGQLLGTGDIAPYDLVNIARNILPEELFVVVGYDKCLKLGVANLEELEPELLAQIAYWVVGKGCIWKNAEQHTEGDRINLEGYGEVELISPAEILSIIKTARIVNC